MRIIIIVGCVVLFCLYACSHTKTVLYDKDSGSTCTLSPGDTLQIVLKSNPTTGYVWKLSSLDTTVVKMTKKRYIPDKVPKFTVGSGGRTKFRFSVVDKGSTEVKLIYHRPFEKGIPPVKTFKAIIKIK